MTGEFKKFIKGFLAIAIALPIIWITNLYFVHPFNDINDYITTIIMTVGPIAGKGFIIMRRLKKIEQTEVKDDMEPL